MTGVNLLLGNNLATSTTNKKFRIACRFEMVNVNGGYGIREANAQLPIQKSTRPL